MAVSDLSDYIARVSSDTYRKTVQISRIGRVAGAAAVAPIANVPVSTWLYDGDGTQGSAPGSTPVTHSQSSQGAIRLANASGGRTNYLAGGMISCITLGHAMLIDRLASVSGLSGTTTTEQSFSSSLTLPTRASSGVGVLAAFEVYTQIGSSATTFQLKYTNTADTTGQLSPAIAIGGTNNRNAQLFRQIPSVAGDLGVKSAESVDLLATTGTAGDWGVVLYKVLAIFPLNLPISFLAGVPELMALPADVCPQLVIMPSTTSVAICDGQLTVVEA
jgi:hypothetical protein